MLILGDSLSEFMRTLGVYSSAGGVANRLRNQMDRLFNAHVSMIYEDERGKATVNSLIARRTEFWWNPKRPDERVLWESKIELGEDFFNEIIQHPVPLDMNTLTALKRSSLGLDLYLWLVYRTFPLRAPQRITWRQVYGQFGVDPARASDRVTVRNFQREVLRELKKIQAGLDGTELLDGSGRFDPASLDTGYRAAQSRPARSLDSPFPPQGSPLTAPATRGHRLSPRR